MRRFFELTLDLLQSLLSNCAFQQIARIPNGGKKWPLKTGLGFAILHVAYFLGQFFGCKRVSENTKIPNGSKPWSQRPNSGWLSYMYLLQSSFLLSKLFALTNLLLLKMLPTSCGPVAHTCTIFKFTQNLFFAAKALRPNPSYCCSSRST